MSPATQRWELQPSGPLAQPTEMTVPLSSPLPAGADLTAVTWADAADTPEYLPATVTQDGHHARYLAIHFSFVQFFQNKVLPGAANVLRTVLEDAFGGAVSEAARPHCDGEQDVKRQGLAISSSSTDTVYWCLGTESNGPILKIVNNRRYALAVHHPGLVAANPGLADLVDPSTSGVRPREEVRLPINLLPGTETRLNTEFDGMTDSINTAFVAFDALTTILGWNEATRVGALAKDAGDIKTCVVGTASRDVTRYLQQCFSADALAHYLGKGAATILGIAGAVGTLLDWARSRLNYAGDALNHRDLYSIVVRNTAAPSIPAATDLTASTPAGTNPAVGNPGSPTTPGSADSVPVGTGTAPAGATGSSAPASPPAIAPRASRPETAGGNLATWTNYASAGGTAGRPIAKGQTVAIACRVSGFRTANGNTNWYRVASAPWNNGYYVSADGFFNNGRTSGPLKGTPFVDAALKTC